jgi:hypothetical protein
VGPSLCGRSFFHFSHLLSQEGVFVAQRAIRTPQRVQRPGHAGHRQLAGSSTLSEHHELLVHEGPDGAVTGASPGRARFCSCASSVVRSITAARAESPAEVVSGKPLACLMATIELV